MCLSDGAGCAASTVTITGINGSCPGLVSEKMAGMEKYEVTEFIGVLEVACVSGVEAGLTSGVYKSSGSADEHRLPSNTRYLCKTR